MPGFSIKGENANISKKNKAEYRRKHRWRVADLSDGPVTPADFLQLKTAQRPSFTLSEDEVHHDQEVAYFAGKQTWDPIELTFYDAVQGAGANDIAQKLYEWVSTVAEIPQATVSLPSAYKKTLLLQMTSNEGTPDETWELLGAWPSKSNWQDLDYSQSEIQTVSITIRFDRAVRVSGDS